MKKSEKKFFTMFHAPKYGIIRVINQNKLLTKVLTNEQFRQKWQETRSDNATKIAKSKRFRLMKLAGVDS